VKRKRKTEPEIKRKHNLRNSDKIKIVIKDIKDKKRKHNLSNSEKQKTKRKERKSKKEKEKRGNTT